MGLDCVVGFDWLCPQLREYRESVRGWSGLGRGGGVGGEDGEDSPRLSLFFLFHLLLSSVVRLHPSSRPSDRATMKCSGRGLVSPILLLFLLLFAPAAFQVCRSDFPRIPKRTPAAPPLGSIILPLSGNVYPLGYALASMSRFCFLGITGCLIPLLFPPIDMEGFSQVFIFIEFPQFLENILNLHGSIYIYIYIYRCIHLLSPVVDCWQTS